MHLEGVDPYVLKNIFFRPFTLSTQISSYHLVLKIFHVNKATGFVGPSVSLRPGRRNLDLKSVSPKRDVASTV